MRGNADPGRPRATNLFSPDGRYIALDGNVVDLETKRRFVLDCDLLEIAWYPGPRFACANPSHDAILVLDLRDQHQQSYADAGTTFRPIFPSERFTGWIAKDDASTTLVDIDTGAKHVVPGRVERLVEDAGKTVAVVSKSSVDPDGVVNQLWDVGSSKAMGEPYRWQRTQYAVSPDGFWALGANLDQGQFLVNHRTGARQTVATVVETVDAFVERAPFSQDNTQVAIATRGTGIRIVDMATGVTKQTVTAKGCETAIQAKFVPATSGGTPELLVMGGIDMNVCAFDLPSGELRWRVDLRTANRTSKDPQDEMSPYVQMLDFTRGGEGVVAGGDTSRGRGYGVVLRRATGDIATPVFELTRVIHNAAGDLMDANVIILPDLTVAKRGQSGDPFSCESRDDFDRCLSGPVPGSDQWRDVSPLAIDRALQRVAGIVGDKLRVWKVSGELLYEQ